jgi:hypothetical protein
LRMSWDNWIPKIYSWSKHVKQMFVMKSF